MNETRYQPIASFAAAPFIVGAADSPRNPAPFPDVAPLALEVDTVTGLVRQVFNPQVDALLTQAYTRGSLLGTAMDDTDAGRAYAEDFLGFVESVIPVRGREVLEIGAGRGHFLTMMGARGAHATGIEPGAANAPYWRDKGVNVICDFFPSAQLQDRFDIILGYAVLEHLADPALFLAAVRDQLRPDGTIVFAVPDCGAYIADGDPGMLLHEHWNYFSETTLARAIEQSGFSVIGSRKAGVGSVLHIAARPAPTPPLGDATEDIAAALAFGEKSTRLRQVFTARAAGLTAGGKTLGLYVAGRALMWLEPMPGLRFFDDDPDLTGRYFPPFDVAIETRSDLLARPVDELWVLSRSFGARIANTLQAAGIADTRVIGVNELLDMARR